MLTRSVVAEDNFTEVVVGIEYDGGAEALRDCFQSDILKRVEDIKSVSHDYIKLGKKLKKT